MPRELIVTVVAAKGLENKDTGILSKNLSDPFAVVQFEDNKPVKTKIIEDNLDPEVRAHRSAHRRRRDRPRRGCCGSASPSRPFLSQPPFLATESRVVAKPPADTRGEAETRGGVHFSEPLTLSGALTAIPAWPCAM